MQLDKSLSPLYDARLVRTAAYASVSVAFVLILIKAMAWHLSGAISLQATLIDSLLDAAASLINMFAIHHAQRPPNHQYRFGHGKAEAIAALGQSIVITLSAAWLLYDASQRFFIPEIVVNTTLGISVMIVAMILTALLVHYQQYVVKKTNSAAIRADSVHYRSDLLMNLGVIFSLSVMNWFHWAWIDPLCGALISFYILYTAWDISLHAFYILMDRELPEPMRQEILEVVLSHPSVKGVHDLKTRSSGLKHFIQLHLELEGGLSLKKAHDIADEVEASILKHFPDTELLIHQDPEGLVERNREEFE